MDDTTQRIEVDIPRQQLITLRRLHGGAPLKESIERSIATYASGWQKGIEISKEGMDEISSLLNVQTFNSEASLLDAIRKRLNVSKSTVVLEIDEVLAVELRRKAHGNNVNFNDYVKRFVHSAFRSTLLDWDMHTIFFNEQQWQRLRRALEKIPCTGDNISRLMEERAHLKKGNGAASPPEEPKVEAKTADQRNQEAAIAADEERKRKMKAAAALIDPASPEYRERLAKAMDKSVAKKPEITMPHADEPPQANAAGAEIPEF